MTTIPVFTAFVAFAMLLVSVVGLIALNWSTTSARPWLAVSGFSSGTFLLGFLAKILEGWAS